MLATLDDGHPTAPAAGLGVEGSKSGRLKQRNSETVKRAALGGIINSSRRMKQTSAKAGGGERAPLQLGNWRHRRARLPHVACNNPCVRASLPGLNDQAMDLLFIRLRLLSIFSLFSSPLLFSLYPSPSYLLSVFAARSFRKVLAARLQSVCFGGCRGSTSLKSSGTDERGCLDLVVVQCTSLRTRDVHSPSTYCEGWRASQYRTAMSVSCAPLIESLQNKRSFLPVAEPFHLTILNSFTRSNFSRDDHVPCAGSCP